MMERTARKGLSVLLALLLAMATGFPGAVVAYAADAVQPVASLSFHAAEIEAPVLGDIVPDRFNVQPGDGNSLIDDSEVFASWRVKQPDGSWDYADPTSAGARFEAGREYRLRFDIQNLKAAAGVSFPDSAPAVTVNGMGVSVVTDDGVADSYYTKTDDATASFALYSKAFKVSDAVPAAERIYVRTFATAPEDGTQAHPYGDFKTAYAAARPGDTIVLLNSVTIQNDDNGSDTGVFTFNKELTIEGAGKDSALTSRVPVQLGAGTLLKNTEFFTDAVFLNGYPLTMDAVKTNRNSVKRVTVYGGSRQGTTASGDRSSLSVTGFAQDPFEFDGIFAGAEAGASGIPVTVTLESGAKVLQAMDASGKTDAVSAAVTFVVGNAGAPMMVNTHGTADSSLRFKGHTGQMSPVIQGYKNVTLEDSQIKEARTGTLSSVSGKLELLGASVLDISEGDAVLTVGELAAEAPSRVVLNKDSGKLSVAGPFTGVLELRTPGRDVHTSGVAKLNWPYLEAALSSTGKVVFHPFVTQGDAQVEDVANTRRQWMVREQQVDRPIAAVEIAEGNDIDLLVPAHELTLVARDKDGNPIAYEPDYEIQLRDRNGAAVPEEEMGISYDTASGKLQLVVKGDALQPGTFTLVVTEHRAGKVLEVPLSLRRQQAPASYAIAYDANGGAGSMAAQSAGAGEAVILSGNAFTKEGCTFMGWATARDGGPVYRDGQEVVDLADPGKTVTLYASWGANRYDVTFDAQGGSPVETQRVVHGGLVSEPANPVREGRAFAGWYADAGYTRRWDFGADRVTAPGTQLVAKWDPVAPGEDGLPATDASDTGHGGKTPTGEGEPAAPAKRGIPRTGDRSGLGLLLPLAAAGGMLIAGTAVARNRWRADRG